MAKIITGIGKLENEIRERNPNKIRSILASILNEYKPSLAKDNKNFINKNDEKANA